VVNHIKSSSVAIKVWSFAKGKTPSYPATPDSTPRKTPSMAFCASAWGKKKCAFFQFSLTINDITGNNNRK
jgi:hypothetical protein